MQSLIMLLGKSWQKKKTMAEGIIIACIGATGAIIAALLQSLKRENAQDHAIVADGLRRIEQKIDSHIVDHAKGDL